MMSPPGAAISGLRVRSGATPHAENSEAVGLFEASTMPECVTVTVTSAPLAAARASRIAAPSRLVMVTVGIDVVEPRIAW